MKRRMIMTIRRALEWVAANRRRIIRWALAAIAAAGLVLAYHQLGERVLFLLALGFIALGSTLFVVVYHALMRWWETAVGQNIMMLMFALAAITDLAFANIIFSRPEWIRSVFLGLYLVIGAAIWWRLALLIQAYREQSQTVDEPVQRAH